MAKRGCFIAPTRFKFPRDVLPLMGHIAHASKPLKVFGARCKSWATFVEYITPTTHGFLAKGIFLKCFKPDNLHCNIPRLGKSTLATQ
jgi:hypothetical protein